MLKNSGINKVWKHKRGVLPYCLFSGCGFNSSQYIRAYQRTGNYLRHLVYGRVHKLTATHSNPTTSTFPWLQYLILSLAGQSEFTSLRGTHICTRLLTHHHSYLRHVLLLGSCLPQTRATQNRGSLTGSEHNECHWKCLKIMELYNCENGSDVHALFLPWFVWIRGLMYLEHGIWKPCSKSKQALCAPTKQTWGPWCVPWERHLHMLHMSQILDLGVPN